MSKRRFPRSKVRHEIARVRRLLVLLRDDYSCYLCRRSVRWYPPSAYRGDRPPPDAATVDHVTPLARGGDGSLDNLRACCLECNGKKGDTPPQPQHLLGGV